MSPPVANVDDVAGFMAAARGLKLANTYGTPPAPAGDVSVDVFTPSLETHDDEPKKDLLCSASHHENSSDLMSHGNGNSQEDNDQKSLTGVFGGESNTSTESHASEMGSLKADYPMTMATAVASDVSPFSPNAGTPDVRSSHMEEETDREHLTTFKDWGLPAVRDKPASQVRRIIISHLPGSWSTPDKVLSLVHGGMVESINLSPSGNTAYVLFCEAEACKAFYEKYPNGIDLDKERKYTVFVDIGKEIDVVSSQLSFNLSVGSTRVVRAVGVDMEVTMSQLIQVASANNRKVEKIIDSYVPGYARNVSFRFCNIDDAVRFRAMIIRVKEWEHCNVQYATDPCEVATGYHTD